MNTSGRYVHVKEIDNELQKLSDIGIDQSPGCKLINNIKPSF